MFFIIGYDESVNPSITNDFATAAMRYGHSQIQGLFHSRDDNYNAMQDIQLSTVSVISQLLSDFILCTTPFIHSFLA